MELPYRVEEFRCNICHDAGFVHPVINGRVDYSSVVPCVCRKEEIARQKTTAMLNMCRLPERSADWMFDKFEVSPLLKEVYDAALQLANESGDVKWLTLLGRWDRGKTHLLVAICRQWLARGRPARYAYVPLLFKELRRSFGEEGEYDRVFDFFCKVPLLALDDLGVEKSTPWVIEQLDTIIDYRYVNGLPLVVTSNLALTEFPPRIASRLQRESWCRVIDVKAPEHRLSGK